MRTNTKFIFVTGGVISSLGKGIAAAALASLLRAQGFKVRLRKLEPYINIDPGTMSPYQHGEVYVTEDGVETDLDIGHYERFTGINNNRHDIVSTGAIYEKVISHERKGGYLGATIQVIPHITDAIKQFIYGHIEDEDFVIYEVGGTVGDIEGLPFLEAIRQVANDRGRDKVMFLHLVLLPYIKAAGELKTKPAQHSVKALLNIGIQPDVLLCRSELPIASELRDKLALFCNVQRQRVIEAVDVTNIYEVPLSLHRHKLDRVVMDYFDLQAKSSLDLSVWHNIENNIKRPKSSAITVGIIGKYTELKDAYKSLQETMIHVDINAPFKVNVKWINSEHYRLDELKALDAIIVPGGFGNRGIEGKLAAIKYAREHKIPFLGICLGLQLAVIESLQNVLGLSEANSSELAATSMPVVSLMTEWQKDELILKRNAASDLGGTMRLGAYPCCVQTGSLAHRIYKQDLIYERHRHRYEVNLEYKQQFNNAGLVFSGMSPDGLLSEIVERPDHPFFIGVQFHPELKSKPHQPHPLFKTLCEVAYELKQPR